ncbi:MAG: WD40 repeat domain-containing protein [Pirellulales bacterium]
MHSIFARSVALGLIACWSPVLAATPDTKSDYTLVLQAPPATSVDSVAVSPDGSLVATAAGEGGVRLYDAKTGTLVRTIGDIGDRDVVFSPDGRTLTAAGFHMDKLVKVVDVHTGKRMPALAGQTEWEADATAFSPDGKLLASTGTDKQILVWDLATGTLRHQIKDQPFRAAAIAFSPDSATLASGGSDKQIHLWDMATGQLRGSLAGHRDWIATLAFAPNGKTIASGSCNWGFHRGHGWELPAGSPPEQCEWRLWDVGSGKLLRTVADTGRMLALAFAPDSMSLACGIDQEVRLYDLSAATAGRVVTRHDATVTSVAFTPNGDAIISGSHDQTVRRTTVATGELEWHAPGYFEHVNSVSLSDDATLLVTGSSDQRFARAKLHAGAQHIGPGAVRLWDAKTGRMLRRLGASTVQVMAVAISSDGRRVAGGGALASGAGFVHVWDAATGQHMWSTNDHEKEVLAVAFGRENHWLATASADGLVTIRDAQSGRLVRKLADHKGGATSLAFTPDGNTLVCGEAFGGTRIWDTRDGRLLHTCSAANSQAESFTIDRLMNSIGLSQDGRTLATCASSVNNEFVAPVRIWDVRAGTLLRDFTAENIHGRPMALSPDGSILATGGKAVQLWDVRTGKKLHKLFGHLKRTQSIVFSSDGRRLFAGGSYGTTNLWDVATGRHLITLFAFTGNGNDATVDDWLAYAPEGFYAGSPGIERYLAWRAGDELLTAEMLAPQLHRPDRIESALNFELQVPGSP